MKRISFKLLIAVTVTLSMALLASVLIFQGYRGMQSGILEVADQASRQLTVTINDRIQKLMEPNQMLIRMLRHDPLISTDDPLQRLSRLPAIAEILKANTLLSAVYIGYDNADFLLLRQLHTAQARAFFGAPEGSYYLLQSVVTDVDEGRRGEWLFYDASLNDLIEVRSVPHYTFDPHSRPWYQQSLDSESVKLTAPYLFYTTQEVGVSMSLHAGDGVVLGIDATVMDLSEQMDSLRLTPGTEIAIINQDELLLAYPDIDRFILSDARETRLATLGEINVPVLQSLVRQSVGTRNLTYFNHAGQNWYGFVSPLAVLGDDDLRILIAIPGQELLGNVEKSFLSQVQWAFSIMLVLLLSGWAVGQRIGNPIAELEKQVRSLANLNFDNKITTQTSIREVHALARVLDDMSSTIRHFKSLSMTLNRERDPDQLLQSVLEELVMAVGHVSGCIYLFDSPTQTLKLNNRMTSQTLPESIELSEAHEMDGQVRELVRKAGYDFYVCTMLRDRYENLLGVLIIDAIDSRSADIKGLRAFIDDISGAAAVAIETRQMIREQKALIDGIIRLIADAIDAKSPYTSGHCERVPELAIMLSDAALRSELPAFQNYQMNEAETEAFRIAAWLHDCGKITSPEYVVDKATKLETIYNRIHEIRTRFEVLYRDAEIDCLQGILDGMNPETLKSRCNAVQQQLIDEFSFIASANMGGEFMSDADVDRIYEIGSRRWTRHFSNRIGLSQDEKQRLEGLPEEVLPTGEPLLSDRPEQVFPWHGRKPPVAKDDPDNHWGFDMLVPEVAYNQGEMYNLTISKGTLTEEERFKINEHIVQTIIMLDALPLPDYLAKVPAIAGNHHEKMDASGYPRRLPAGEMSLQERIMAVADVFEALTAVDRPYKQGKTLTQSLAIMARMVAEEHLDADVFELFLRSGIYQQYAQKFMQPEQIDRVDINQFLVNVTEAP
ncbi:HD domain-containing phosphohydrolase [Nitrincola iocasae]|uniref:HAMP domain-containing protein n=1 Tax=Nitrincola iocasae TaxID=2614693 RepID=A0A5J6LFG0_9GAMM|nr:HD domain-containing phosphohydrolase [Nitrincola iocasae]QEW07275.1 HAMP domain-containing protein [Nitrincola iocasae]